MKLKIKDQLPDTEIFQLVDGEPQKSKLREPGKRTALPRLDYLINSPLRLNHIL